MKVFSSLMPLVAATLAVVPAELAIAQSFPPLPIQFDPNSTPSIHAGSLEEAIGGTASSRQRVQFNPDQLINPGRPGGRRRGGGSRGECSADPALTAIVYARTVSELGIEGIEETVGTLTTQAQPKLWFYLPTALSENTQTLLTLKSSDDTLLYEGHLLGSTDRAGMVGVTLPVDLAVGQIYYWSFALACGESGPSENEAEGDSEQSMVDGWIERRAIDPALSRTFEQADTRNRAALYANYGFLQDAVSELATLHLANPDDEAIAQDWANFLNDLDLADLTDAPLLGLLECCQNIAPQSLEATQVPDAEVFEVVEENSTELGRVEIGTRDRLLLQGDRNR